MPTECQISLQDQYSERYLAFLARPAAELKVAGKRYLEGAQPLIDWLEERRPSATETVESADRQEDAKKITRTVLNLSSAVEAVETMLKEIR